MKKIAQATKHVACTKLGEEYVIVNLETDRFFSLSPTASRCFELLINGYTFEEISGQLSQEYAVSPDTLTYEFDALIEALANEGLITVRLVTSEDK